MALTFAEHGQRLTCARGHGHLRGMYAWLNWLQEAIPAVFPQTANPVLRHSLHGLLLI